MTSVPGPSNVNDQQRVRDLAAAARDMAALADTATAHPSYQSEKVWRAWCLLTRALVVLGADRQVLEDAIERAWR
jgi:hypothetical protein